MTSLKHGVNLSRRACRRGLCLLLAAASVAHLAGNPVEVSFKTPYTHTLHVRKKDKIEKKDAHNFVQANSPSKYGSEIEILVPERERPILLFPSNIGHITG